MDEGTLEGDGVFQGLRGYLVLGEESQEGAKAEIYQGFLVVRDGLERGVQL